MIPLSTGPAAVAHLVDEPVDVLAAERLVVSKRGDDGAELSQTVQGWDWLALGRPSG